MKKILIPFDFNEVSINAVRYAFEAFKDKAEFIIVHVTSGNLDLNDPITYTAGFTRGDALLVEMEKVIQKVNAQLELETIFKTRLEIGGIVDNLIRIVKKEKVDAIVMGTRDKYDVVDRWFGTVSLGIVKRAEAPVYLIPKNCSYAPYHKVVVAADKHLESDKVLEMLISWNTGFKADMHFLHVLDDNNQHFAANIVEEFFEKRNLDFPFTITQLEKSNISDAIIQYADNKAMDLQIIVSDNMSWLETMLSKSVSKQLISRATKPLLFVHSGYKKRSQIFF